MRQLWIENELHDPDHHSVVGCRVIIPNSSVPQHFCKGFSDDGFVTESTSLAVSVVSICFRSSLYSRRTSGFWRENSKRNSFARGYWAAKSFFSTTRLAVFALLFLISRTSAECGLFSSRALIKLSK